MKRIIQLLSILSFVPAVFAQPTNIVTPNGLANVEGNSSSAGLFNTAGSQLLQVYSASDFGFASGVSGLVTSVSFRLDGATAQSFSGFWPSIGITLSTTPRSPDSLSPVFNDNIGADGLQVFANTFVIRATNTVAFPRNFEIQIPFATPFWYDPAKGNLSMYMNAIGGPATLLLDAQNTLGDGVGRVLGPDGSTSGITDTLGLVTRFGITEVPEPGVVAIGTLALAVFWSFFRKRKKDRTI